MTEYSIPSPAATFAVGLVAPPEPSTAPAAAFAESSL